MFSFARKLPNYFPRWLRHFAFPPTRKKVLLASHFPLATGIVFSFLDFSHTNRCGVVSVLNLHFLIIRDVEHLFMCLLAVCMFPWVKCLLKYFPHFFIQMFVFLLLSLIISLCNLAIGPLLNICFSNIFSQSEVFLLILLAGSFAEPIFILIKSNLSIFSHRHALGVYLEAHYQTQDHLECIRGGEPFSCQGPFGYL